MLSVGFLSVWPFIFHVHLLTCVCQAPIHKRDLLFSRKTAIVLLYCMYLYIYSLHYSVCVVHIYPCYDYKTFLERWLYI